MDIDFSGSTLYMHPRSPFVRRVRLVFLECGIACQEIQIDVFRPNPKLIPLNLLSRIPTLVLKSGEVLPDSDVILDLFFKVVRSPLRPTDPKALLLSLEWTGLSTGIMEKTVEFYLEKLRPEESRDPELLEDIHGQIGRYLEALEAIFATRATLVPGRLTQGDLDIGTALAYLGVRYHPEALLGYPNVTRYLSDLGKRPSFQKTIPPLP